MPFRSPAFVSVALLAAVTPVVLVPFSMAQVASAPRRPLAGGVAQQDVPPPATAPRRPPLLRVTQPDGKAHGLPITKADVRVAIAGPLAKTTLTMTFRNDQPRVVEGDLEFPLPEGAALSGYGLDVGGTLVDGVPVEKQAARIAFEKEVRKGVDPGLVEQTGGNQFRTRVYPIPAGGTRTVKIEYVSDLTTSGNDIEHVVPLRWNQNILLATFHIEVAEFATQQPGTTAQRAVPTLRLGGRDRVLEFQQQGGSNRSSKTWTAEKTLEEVAFNGDLTIRLPGAAPAPQVSVEAFGPAREDTGVPSEEPEYYFALRDVPPVQEEAARIQRSTLYQQTSGGNAPRRVGIVWDASLSRRSADIAREMNLLSRLLKDTAGTGPLTVDVTVLRNIAEPIKKFTVTRGDTREVLRFLQSTPFDGGTDLGALRFPRDKGRNAVYRYYLLFTDGHDSLGSETIGEASVPVYTISSDRQGAVAGANFPFLRRLADKSGGGAYIDLDRMSDEEARQVIRGGAYSLLSVGVADGRVDGIYPGGVRPVSANTIVTGRLLSDTAILTLNYGVARQVTTTRRFLLRRQDATQAGLIARYWAKQKADDLCAFPEKNQDDLLALGRAYNIVTPNTSLLVLETLEQYLEHGVTPPQRTRPALYRAYMDRRAQTRVAEKKGAAAKLRHVVSLWNERVRWANTTFRYARDFRYQKNERDKQSRVAFSRMQQVQLSGGRPYYFARPAAVAARPASPQVPGAPSGRYSGGGYGGGYPEPERNRTSKEAATREAQAGEITVQPWSPKTPYLKAMRAAGPARAYGVYLEQRSRYASSPAFYLDCAEYLLQNKKIALGVRVLTSIADLRLDDPQLSRILAHRLAQLGYRNRAIALFQQIQQQRPDEPQSGRDIALVLSERADDQVKTAPRAATRDYNRALSLLHKVVTNRWDRFEEIEVIALMEANGILTRARRVLPAALVVNPFDSRLVRPIPCSVRILLSWDTDQTDMDLWVTEPSGEQCLYSHNRTVIGGRLSRDFTQGYGPEEYCLRRAMPGVYKIQANYYGTSQQRLTGGTTVQATVITDFGLPTEKRRFLTLRLRAQKDTVEIGSIKVAD